MSRFGFGAWGAEGRALLCEPLLPFTASVPAPPLGCGTAAEGPCMSLPRWLGVAERGWVCDGFPGSRNGAKWCHVHVVLCHLTRGSRHLALVLLLVVAG